MPESTRAFNCYESFVFMHLIFYYSCMYRMFKEGGTKFYVILVKMNQKVLSNTPKIS